jgi:NDP-sugar pyrophosphorylase family protein
MVLAAGLGTRMRPLSRILAKPVLPVLNRPLLHWTLELLARDGVTDVVINLHHLPDTVRRAVGDGGSFGLRVRWSHEPRILGTGGGPRRVRRWLGDEPFFLVNGDMAFDFDLRALAAAHRRSGARATLALRPNPDPERYRPVVTDRRGWIRSIAGLPRPARGTVSLFTGVHVLDPALLDRLPPGRTDVVRDLYGPLLAAGEGLRGIRVEGAWYDLGDPNVYRVAQVAMLGRGFRGRSRRAALVDPGARVARSARVVRSILGRGCRIEDGAVVKGSVLWGGARVGAGAAVVDSVLASGVQVGPGRTVRDRIVTASRA